AEGWLKFPWDSLQGSFIFSDLTPRLRAQPLGITLVRTRHSERQGSREARYRHCRPVAIMFRTTLRSWLLTTSEQSGDMDAGFSAPHRSHRCAPSGTALALPHGPATGGVFGVPSPTVASRIRRVCARPLTPFSHGGAVRLAERPAPALPHPSPGEGRQQTPC